MRNVIGSPRGIFHLGDPIVITDLTSRYYNKVGQIRLIYPEGVLEVVFGEIGCDWFLTGDIRHFTP